MLQKDALEKDAFLMIFPYFGEKTMLKDCQVNFPGDSKLEIIISKLRPEVPVI